MSIRRVKDWALAVLSFVFLPLLLVIAFVEVMVEAKDE